MFDDERVVPIEILVDPSHKRPRKRFVIKDEELNLYRTDAPPTSREAWSSARGEAQTFLTAEDGQRILEELFEWRLGHITADEMDCLKKQMKPAVEPWQAPWKTLYHDAHCV
jgi:hypothetical protein